MRFRDFMWRRFERLYPAYLIGFILGLLVAAAALRFGGSGLSVSWTPIGLICAAVPNLILVPQAFCGVGGLLFPINPPMWSIFYELIVNALFFAAVTFLLWRRSLVLALLGVIVKFAPGMPDAAGALLGVGMLLVLIIIGWLVGRHYEPQARRALGYLRVRLTRRARP